ncbi:MAG: T9SS type A sorting domain-containing protein [Bacteroidia bacterium]|nr:T9SS type A sorting domain-containing protein [Bacteroidia bacterium]
MKNMNYWRSLLFVVFVVFFGSLQAQVCEPDTTVPSLGLFPSSLPDGFLGSPYSSTLNAGLPRDTTIIGQVFDFCFYRIDSTQPNLSTLGLQFDCDQPGCQYTVDHSKPLNFGCVVVSGTPTQTFNDSIVVFVKAAIGNFDGTSCTVTDSTTFEALEFKVPFRILLSNSISNSAEFGTVSLMPNPASDLVQLDFEIREVQNVAIEVLDLSGKTVKAVRQATFLPGKQNVEFSTGELAEGLYMVRVLSLDNGRMSTQKLMVRR